MKRELFDLLEKRNKVSYRLLELFQLEEDWLEVKKISSELSISERSVQRYIHFLEEVIEEYNQEQEKNIELVYEKFKGVKLFMSDSSIEHLKLHIIYNDEHSKLLIDLCMLRTENIKKYAEKNFINIYSLKHSIKKINETLKSFHLEIDSNKLTFIGEEKLIRFFIYVFLWTIYRNSDWPFEYVDEAKIYKSIDYVESLFKVGYTAVYKKQAAYFMAICLMRNKKKHYITDTENWHEYVNIRSLRAEQVMVTGMNHYQIFDDNELTFILLVFEMRHRVYRSSYVGKRILNYHKKNNSDVYRATNLMFEKFQKDFFKIPYGEQNMFYTYFFCTHLQNKIFPGVYFDLVGYDSLGDSKPPRNLIEKLTTFIDEMKTESSNAVFDNNELLIKRYLLVFSYFGKGVVYEPQINIVIDSDMSFLVRARLKQIIQHHFAENYNLVMTDEHSSANKNSLIITNMSSINGHAEDICVVEHPLQHTDIQIIEKKLEEKLERIYAEPSSLKK